MNSAANWTITYIAPYMRSVEIFVTLKLRDRNNSIGTSGFGDRAIQMGNAIDASTPITSETNATGSFHCWDSPLMTPNVSPPTAAATTMAPTQSTRPVASSSRDSGIFVSVAHSAHTTRGTLIQNAARHE